MRLIDVDKLAEYIAENEQAFVFAIKSKDLTMLEDIILDIPTAYDVDKVVKELNEWTFNANIDVGDGTVMNHNLIVKDVAIDIVKAGMANES